MASPRFSSLDNFSEKQHEFKQGRSIPLVGWNDNLSRGTCASISLHWLVRISLAVALLTFNSDALAWSWQGHKLVGEIAWQYMTETAREQAYLLLHSGRDTPGYPCDDGIFSATTDELAFTGAMSWADCARGTDVRVDFPEFTIYHADRFPLCPGMGASACGTGHCATDVLVQSIRDLGDERLPEAARRVALKMLLHLMGDLHQPLHVTTTAPVEVSVMPRRGSEPIAFHGYWDRSVSLLVMEDLQSLQDLVAREHAAYRRGDVESWVLATNDDGNTAYATLYAGQDMCAVIGPDPVQITEAYEAAAVEIGRRKIGQAGIRLAEVLNDTFARRAYSQTVQAEDYTDMQGAQTAPTSDTRGGSYVGWLEAGDWTAYRQFDIPRAGLYTIRYRVASRSGRGTLSAELNAGSTLLGDVAIPATGGWDSWTTVNQPVRLPDGRLDLRLHARQGGWNINWIEIESVDSVSHTIEAEDYASMSGVDTDLTKDVGGTEYVGWIQDNDWMAFDVDIPISGKYTISYRVASSRGGGILAVDTGAESVGRVDIPSTGAWDTWTTVRHAVELPAGDLSFRILAQRGGWNINWFNIVGPSGPNASGEVLSSSDDVRDADDRVPTNAVDEGEASGD
jgi:hypothetical protein